MLQKQFQDSATNLQTVQRDYSKVLADRQTLDSQLNENRQVRKTNFVSQISYILNTDTTLAILNWDLSLCLCLIASLIPGQGGAGPGWGRDQGVQANWASAGEPGSLWGQGECPEENRLHQVPGDFQILPISWLMFPQWGAEEEGWPPGQHGQEAGRGQGEDAGGEYELSYNFYSPDERDNGSYQSTYLALSWQNIFSGPNADAETPGCPQLRGMTNN